MSRDSIEAELSGGHPNSLGNTVSVVNRILGDPPLLEDLVECYGSDDAVVRLRVSNAVKRISAARPEWLVPYLDRLLTSIAALDQASTQWTLALLYDRLREWMTDEQRQSAVAVMQRNLAATDDWIVQNTTMQVLSDWGRSDDAIAEWLHPRLIELAESSRVSVANRARKLLDRTR